MTIIKIVLAVLGVALILCEIYCISHETPLPYVSKYISSWTGIFVGLGTVFTIFFGRLIALLLWAGAVLMSLFYFIRFLFFKEAFVSSADWIDAFKTVGGLTAGGIVFWLFGSKSAVEDGGGGGGGGCPSGPFPPGPNTPRANTPTPERIWRCRFCGRENPEMKPGFIFSDDRCDKSPNGYHQLI